MGLEVCLNAPNIIGYIRVLLVFCAWGAFNIPAVFVPTYIIFSILDGLDGWVARRLNQTSEFGAWLDVVIDNLGRGMLWSMLFEWGWLVSSVEWCTFACNYSARGAQWKNSFAESPFWVQAVMEKGFKTPPGVLVIGGLYGLPLWLYGCQRGMFTLWAPPGLQTLGLLVLAAGRLLCFSVEMWCILTHVKYLTGNQDADKKD